MAHQRTRVSPRSAGPIAGARHPILLLHGCAAAGTLLALVSVATADGDDPRDDPTAATNGTDASTDSADGDTARLRGAKIGLIVSIAVGTFLASLLPWYIARLKRSIAIMRVCCCAAAGVILGAAFTHMLPDAQDKWTDYFDVAGTSGLRDASDIGYPFAMMIAMFVLLLLTSVDKVFIAHQHGAGEGHGHSHVVPSISESGYVKKASGETPGTAEGSCAGTTRTPSVSSDEQGQTTATTAEDDVRMRSIRPHTAAQMPATVSANAPHPFETPQIDGTCQPPPLVRVEVVKPVDEREYLANGAVPVPTYGSTIRDLTREAEPERGTRAQVVQAWVMATALALHSIMDGLGIGAENSESGLVSMIVAVCGHKILDGFALGVPVYFGRLPFAQTAGVLVASALMTPIGIGIAWAVTSANDGASAKLAEAILVSMSAGSFLFIALIELLPGGIGDGEHVAVKMAVTAVGGGAMALLALWV